MIADAATPAKARPMPLLQLREKVRDGLRPAAKREGELLYIDKSAQLLWAWLPEQPRPNYHLEVPVGSLEVDLGPINPDTTVGRLTFLRLEPEQFAQLKSSLVEFSDVSEAPGAPSPNGIDSPESLRDYILRITTDARVLYAIAWYASSRISAGSLDGLLRATTIADLLRSLPVYGASRNIARDPRLLRDLQEIVLRRRIVFALGGVKSGLSTFISQFRTTLSGEPPAGSHLWVDFDPALFDDVLNYLNAPPNRGLLSPLGFGADAPEAASLFISLAYESYRSLADATRIDRAALESLVPIKLGGDPRLFVGLYITDMTRRSISTTNSGAGISLVETFLGFISDLLDAATGKRLTVVLSFPSLTDWLRERRGAGTADRAARVLWDQLKDFAIANFDNNTGVAIPNSFVSKQTSPVGLLVEMRRMALWGISEGFCRGSIVSLPPYDDSELIAVWQGRGYPKPTDLIIKGLRESTGGAPWFVDLVLDCLDALQASAGQQSSLVDAVRIASEVVRGEPPTAPAAAEAAIHAACRRWQRYADVLKKRMPHALSESDTIFELTLASQSPKSLPKNESVDEWLESGLFWLRSQDQSRLGALHSFPFVLAYPQPTLIELAIDSLRKA